MPCRLATVLLAIVFVFSANAQAATEYLAPALGKKELATLVETTKLTKKDSFKSFLQSISSSDKFVPIHPAIDKFLSGKKLSAVEEIYIYRLLGTFTRVKYQDEILSVLKDLVTYPTFATPGQPQYKNPAVKAFGKALKKIAKSYGLKFRNVKNRIFEVTLRGKASKEVLGIYTHGDVVPVDPSQWTLEDGTKLDPFEAKIHDGKIYGRGTEDDKCSIVAALIVMRTLKEEGLIPNRTIRLIVETTEETSHAGIEYYKKKNKLPDYNLVLDSGYPIITAEKGNGKVITTFPIQNVRDGNHVTSLTGGSAMNVIPKSSTITIATQDTNTLLAAAQKQAKQFVKDNGGNFTIDSRIKKDTVEIEVIGIPSHGSAPEDGLNPVSRAFMFVHATKDTLNLQSNHFTTAAQFFADNFGDDDFGRKLGIAYADPFMGPLTAVVTFPVLGKNQLDVTTNVRIPRGQPMETTAKNISDKLDDYLKQNKISATVTPKLKPFMYRNPKGPWIEVLLDIFGTVTELPSKPLSSSGGTTAKKLPNGINFGPSMPGEKYMGHSPNEFKKISNFMLDVQMFTEAFLRLGNLEKMN